MASPPRPVRRAEPPTDRWTAVRGRHCLFRPGPGQRHSQHSGCRRRPDAGIPGTRDVRSVGSG
ncbi:hypothetical protein ACFFX0_17295 [Citricoccus parietis]|uniref:Uncharacterized protein n=1 Tax=Citricoccus parietis TaxID=592307 RepID=A0ABV5G1P7_9MICC